MLLLVRTRGSLRTFLPSSDEPPPAPCPATLRFGTVALTESERAGLWTVCSDRTDLLLTIVKELVKVTGVR